MGDIGTEEGKIYIFDQLIRQRALDEDQTPLFAYPKSRLGITDYELITGKQLNRLISGAANAFVREGLVPVFEDTIVGVYSPSTLDYLINIYALGRLGYTCFLISPRLPASAVASLLEQTKAQILLHALEHEDLAVQCQILAPTYPIKTLPLLSRSEYDDPNDTNPVWNRDVDPLKEHHRPYIMLHSSGSTGLPKPITYTNARLLVTCLTSPSLVAFQSLPFFHGHGLVTYSQAIWARKTIYLFNGYLPQTNRNLTGAINVAKPEIVWTVPYVLKLLAETEEGVEALKSCRVVSSSGSRCPDELGNMLTEKGVFLGCLFGSTETSLLFTSLTRPRDDKDWNYLRTPPHVLPFILMQPVEHGSELCECIVLGGHRAKSISNSNNPPNSFHTSDLFIAHPTTPNAWKFIGRSDDRVTLLNGEKVLPLPIEGLIIQDPLVREAVVFGVDRAVPGLLLFRANSDEARHLSDQEYLSRTWPTIQDANSKAESFSQIGRDMVVVLGADVEIPCTDKGTFKRAQVYRAFEQVINDAYTGLERNEDYQGTLVFKTPELETWLVSKFEELGVEIDAQSEFFAAGVDSLKAIQMRSIIIKHLDLGGNGAKLGSMIVYDWGNIARLAKALNNIRMGQIEEGRENLSVMKEMIAKYSILPEITGKAQKRPGKGVVVLTGATGFLGAHILAELVENCNVSKVYCLIRSLNSVATSRLSTCLISHSLSHIASSSKIIPLAASLSEPSLGLAESTYSQLVKEATHIIHCAWSVNFSIPLPSFAPQLLGLQNLLSLSVASDADLVFCSSISAALGTTPPAIIPSAPLESLSQSSPTGYGKSKLAAEKIIQKVAKYCGVRSTILRIGQIVPSRAVGRSKLWNPNEMIPLVVRSARVMGCLPDTVGNAGCEWLEVDIVAKVIADVCGFDEIVEEGEYGIEKRLVYNIVHPKSFSWKDDFLPLLPRAGMDFEVVGYDEWLERLRRSDVDVAKNPSRKLLEFWGKQEGKIDSHGGIGFDTGPAAERFRALRTALRVVDGDLVQDLLDAWSIVW